MGIPQDAEPAKLIVGILAAPDRLEEGLGAVRREFAPVESQFPPFDFELTDYYFEEMGRPLIRTWVSLKGLVRQDELKGFKLRTQRIESDLSVWGSRRVNLDPGLLTASKLVLASTKDFAHRIYLGEGIYAEVTLNYRKGKGFTPLDWTFPDYRLPEVLEFFDSLRAQYREELRNRRRNHEENA
jgi:hypothetical protein